MTPSEIEIGAAIDAIERYMALHGHSQSEVKRRTGVDQSQISRILDRRCRRMSKNLRKLCIYAEIGDRPAEELDPSKSPELMRALKHVWKGTEEDARALARVILALGDLRGQ